MAGRDWGFRVSVYAHEREESRSAREAAEREGEYAECYSHSFARDGSRCIHCGMSVDRAEVGV